MKKQAATLKSVQPAPASYIDGAPLSYVNDACVLVSKDGGAFSPSTSDEQPFLQETRSGRDIVIPLSAEDTNCDRLIVQAGANGFIPSVKVLDCAV